jgi:hypothetical protein
MLSVFTVASQAQDSAKVEVGVNFGVSWNIPVLTVTEGYSEVFGDVSPVSSSNLGSMMGLSINAPIAGNVHFLGAINGHLTRTELSYELAAGEVTKWILPLSVNVDANFGYAFEQNKLGLMLVGGASLNQYVSEAGSSQPLVNKTAGTINLGIASLQDRQKLNLRLELLFRYGVTDFAAGGDDVYSLGFGNFYRHTVSLLLHIY